MRLLATSELRIYEFYGKSVPEYAILSHRWDDEEVSFADLVSGAGKALKGWHKIEQCCKLAAESGIKFIWIDTCCIDKASSAELQEAINSMYNWYKNSRVCYVFMNDVSYSEGNTDKWHEDFKISKWFTRGWTLQELLAPSKVKFYDCAWIEIGTRDSLYEEILSITGISSPDFQNPKRASVAKRMSWASKRETTREEDLAYCLLGLFDVKMPLLYGEGSEAFMRLQLEILKRTDDESIFAWFLDGSTSGLLAANPASFVDSYDVESIHQFRRDPYEMTHKGLSFSFPTAFYYPDGSQGVEFSLVPLNCSREGSKSPLCIFLVQHLGISASGLPDPDEMQARRIGPLAQTYNYSSSPTYLRENKLKANVYIRQENDARWRNPYMFSGFNRRYRPPMSRSIMNRRMQQPNPLWHINDTKLEEERLLLGLQLFEFAGDTFNPSSITDEEAENFSKQLSQEIRHSQGSQILGLNSTEMSATLKRLVFHQKQQNNPPDTLGNLSLSLSPRRHSNENERFNDSPGLRKRLDLRATEKKLSQTYEILKRYRCYTTEQWANLYVAAENGHEDVVEILLDEETRYQYVSVYGNQYLIDEGAQKPDDKFFNGRTALSVASEKGHIAVIRLLMETGNVNVNSQDELGRTPLWYAARQGHENVAKLLVQHSADPLSSCYSGQTILHVAARSGNINLVDFFLPFYPDISIPDKQGATVLSYAASGASVPVMERILAQYTTIDTGDCTWSPLHWACIAGSPEHLKLLIKSGVKSSAIKLTDPPGSWTPLRIAKFHNNLALVSEDGHCHEDIPLTLQETNLQYTAQETNRAIYGFGYRCVMCYDCDYCFMCKVTAQTTHPGHEWSSYKLGN